MRWLFWFFLLLLVLIGLSLFAGNNEGYVLIVRPPYRFELSFNLLIVLVLLSFLLLHLLWRVFDYARHLPATVKAYKETRRAREGHQALLEAQRMLLEGRYQQAEKNAAKALELGEDAGLSALTAARAAHKQKRRVQRDFYLAEVERLVPQARVSRLLTQAELLLDDRQYNQALQALQQLRQIIAVHPPALRLELKVQLHLTDWPRVLSLLQQIEKQQALEPWQIRHYRQQAHVELIRHSAGNSRKLRDYWQKLSSDEQLNPRIALAAALAFVAAGDGNQACRIIELSLAKNWDSELAEFLGDCRSDDPIRQLQQAEYWLTVHEGDAGLLLALGKMCIRQQLWGKARSYLEASLSVRPNARAHYVLASMLDSRGEREAAAGHYRQSAQLAQAASAAAR